MGNLLSLDLYAYLAIGGAVVVLIIGYLLLHKFVFQGHKNKRLQNALTHKYNYSHSLLLNENTQHLRRIEAISDINLLMRPVYDEFYKRFEQLRDIEDRRASRAVQIVNEELVKGNKDFKAAYQENRHVISEFENKVMQLNKDLSAVIKPENEIREKSVDDKKAYRAIKSIYRDNKKELELVDPSFEKIFAQLDKLFVQHEEAVSGAFYDEASALLDRIRLILRQLEKVLEVLPLLCVKTTVLIPQKLEFVRRRYMDLERQGIPLPHLMVNAQLDKFNNYIEVAKKSLQRLEIQGIDGQLIEIDRTVSDLLLRFDEEVKQKEVFTANFDKIYTHVNDIERRYIKLVNNMPNVKRIYLITSDADQKLEVIKNKLNDLSNSKRMLDSFNHSSTRQPYSALVEKMTQLKNESEIAEKLLQEYFAHIESLRADAENAHSLIKVLFFELKKIEAKLRDMQVAAFSDKLKDDFVRAYQLIDSIAFTVKQTPIDVIQVNQFADELRTLAKTLNERVDREYNNANLAEATIVYLNRYRTQYSDVQNKLTDEEVRFFNGSFADVYNNSIETVKQFRNR